MADPRRVVIMGAASGIGAATAAHFHHRGDHVLAVDRRRHSTPVSVGREAVEAARGSVGRHATVDDVVLVIEFLASAQAGWVNGQDIQVDGGYVASLVVGMPVHPSATS